MNKLTQSVSPEGWDKETTRLKRHSAEFRVGFSV